MHPTEQPEHANYGPAQSWGRLVERPQGELQTEFRPDKVADWCILAYPGWEEHGMNTRPVWLF